MAIGFNCVAVIRDRAVNLLLLDPIPPASVPDRQGVKENVRSRTIRVSPSQQTNISLLG
jgi:hypothetical protein